MDLEKKFTAAVGVIQNLPKDGSFQTSNEMKLQFYAYYKQATAGPCSGVRPGFWDLVGRFVVTTNNSQSSRDVRVWYFSGLNMTPGTAWETRIGTQP